MGEGSENEVGPDEGVLQLFVGSGKGGAKNEQSLSKVSQI